MQPKHCYLQDIVPKTHSGTIAMLHQHFVQDGSFDIAHAAFLSRLMQERIEDDYNDFIILDEVEILDFIQPANNYVAYIEILLKAC